MVAARRFRALTHVKPHRPGSVKKRHFGRSMESGWKWGDDGAKTGRGQWKSLVPKEALYLLPW